jgi:predicted HAD superfamily Cof-like phosphohydrolase
MKKQLEKVEEFHNAFGQENGKNPSKIKWPESQLRYRLMDEENGEYLEACAKQSLEEIADALGDMLYILCGTILKHGMHHIIEDIFNEIHSSNMSKLGEDGKPILRADGKITKGPNYFRPELSKIIEDASSSL